MHAVRVVLNVLQGDGLGADMPTAERKETAEQTMIMIRMILEGARHLDEAKIN